MMVRCSLLMMCFVLAVPGRSQSTSHPSQSIPCKTCHTCEYPTVNEPCLVDCPREDLVTVRHSAAAGPTTVLMNRLSDRYGLVEFSHLRHAEMSQLVGGCASCHHYNTTGPILKCSSCHESGNSSELGKPGLLAAYHRQCIGCHREWDPLTECQSCHAAKNQKTVAGKKAIRDFVHRVAERPVKRVWETTYRDGPFVTFYHDQHADGFGFACQTCHAEQSCAACHDRSRASMKKVSNVKTEDEKHAACFSCHAENPCATCHRLAEAAPFDHRLKTGWAIQSYHARLACQQCHGSKKQFNRVSNDCNSCHRLATRDGFRHEVTGFKLDGTHSELSCGDCHRQNQFGVLPVCKECHDDKAWPSDKPGHWLK